MENTCSPCASKVSRNFRSLSATIAIFFSSSVSSSSSPSPSSPSSPCTSACASTCPCAGLRRPKLLKKLANVDMDTCFCCWVPLTILSEILATLIVTLSLDLFCRLNEWAKEY
eukprot:CAMPEP_0173173040 /NCGR_PEP_ID=MMETSP1141-20130122/2624_1 /TAXON_ID=483371 /ORGANISM="non described non described, Strain CCMP2298" /LENGTH=112 /DNA_ID=CAMNT_0014095105 /DNA_START=578 /DNA_END=916 /DNA_ORIENTATION=+